MDMVKLSLTQMHKYQRTRYNCCTEMPKINPPGDLNVVADYCVRMTLFCSGRVYRYTDIFTLCASNVLAYICVAEVTTSSCKI